jgi:hypothetical protein
MLERFGITRYGISITKRGLLLTIILSFIFYSSYFVFSLYTPQYFIPSAQNRLFAQAAFNFIIVIALIVSSFSIYRTNRLHIIYACSITTSLLAFLLLIPTDTSRLAFIFLIAVFFSIGQLAFFTYFWRLTMSRERGRVAGLSGFFSLLIYIFMYALVAGTFDFSKTIVLGIAISLAPLVIILLKPETAVLTTKKREDGYNFERRTVILYLIPWVLFCLINATLAKNISFHISQQVPSLVLFLIVLQGSAAVFGALFGGAIADFFGRRISLALSLTLYGISSALAGISTNFALLYFVYFANGFSWGILLVMYTFVIWGDLSNKENCAKMYAIGFIVFYLTQGIGLLPLGQILQIPLVISSLGSCLLIFLSNIPIFLAPELLPSDFREKMRLKLHMSAVKKMKQSQNQG